MVNKILNADGRMNGRKVKIIRREVEWFSADSNDIYKADNWHQGYNLFMKTSSVTEQRLRSDDNNIPPGR